MQWGWLELILGGLVFGWLLQSAMWLIQWRRRDAGTVDVGWTAGVGLLGMVYALQAGGWAPRRYLAAALIGAWALRLAAYIVKDRIWGHTEEDGRYQTLRAHWGASANRNFYFFFTAQMVLIVLFALPVLPGAARLAAGWGAREALALLIWLLAVGGEALADRQLARWRRDPAHRGLTCRQGLWRYSRHPNYFCEWLHWWAYVALGWGAPHQWLAWLGPVLMLVFLYRLSGIPYTEKQALASRGADYRRYQQTTSAFFPWFPRKEESPACKKSST
ncbi:MAG: DUF1295 domain-containing protein [Candidatus Marinimicrobia bacterium]|nr:DUF1295 domain-containing protein [Candidatus Neomarinimicrobiota bacterium]